MNPASLLIDCLFNFDLLLTQEFISLYWRTQKIWIKILSEIFMPTLKQLGILNSFGHST